MAQWSPRRACAEGTLSSPRRGAVALPVTGSRTWVSGPGLTWLSGSVPGVVSADTDQGCNSSCSADQTFLRQEYSRVVRRDRCEGLSAPRAGLKPCPYAQGSFSGAEGCLGPSGPHNGVEMPQNSVSAPISGRIRSQARFDFADASVVHYAPRFHWNQCI